MDSSDLFAICFIVGIIAIVVISSIIESKKAKARAEAIKKYCFSNGLTYREGSDIIPCGGSFKITERGYGQRYRNIVIGKNGETEFTICDFIYETGSGKSHHTYHNTIVSLMNPYANIAPFFCRDENVIFDTLGKLFGGQDINFDEDKEFSKKFVLQSHIEQAARRMFNSKVRKAFVSNHVSGYEYEGSNGTFIICCNRFLEIPERNQFLMKAIKIFQAMCNNQEFLS